MPEPTDLIDELLDVRDRAVLDVGCGEGWLVRRLAAAGARATGLEPLAPALERARSEAGGEDYVEGGAQALPFADDSFDALVFFNSLHHVPEELMDAALAEAARVCRPGGVVFVQEPVAGGEFFELIRPIEDETHVRGAAQAALDRAVAGPLVERSRRDAVVATRLADFEALRRLMISVEPARGAAIDRYERALRIEFERLGRAVDGGREFEQPVTARLLAPA